MRRIFVLGLALAGSAAGVTGASAFAFHCSGNACRAVAFRDEGNGCTVVTNHSAALVHITQGTNQLTYDLAPGETKAPLSLLQCYGYYEGGETANFAR